MMKVGSLQTAKYDCRVSIGACTAIAFLESRNCKQGNQRKCIKAATFRCTILLMVTCTILLVSFYEGI